MKERDRNRERKRERERQRYVECVFIKSLREKKKQVKPQLGA